MRILVIGATGMIGKPVARKLRQDGYQVRILTRDIDKAQSVLGPDFQYVKGDVQQPETIKVALENCHGVHISLKAGPTAESYDRIENRGTETVARLAREAGVERLTFLSGASTARENTWFYVPRAKYNAEKAIQDSGIAYTIFRASWFMETLNLFVKDKRMLKFGKQKSPVHWIAAADFADMVSRTFLMKAAENKILYVYGPETLTLQEGLETYCEIVNPDLQISKMPIWFMKTVAAASRNAELKDAANLMSYYEKISEDSDPSETYKLFGIPPTKLGQWCTNQIGEARAAI
jgi:uncharacterized protein YbjT (DUF2867 family)